MSKDNDWAAALELARSKSTDVVPKEWRSIDQIAVEMNCTTHYARQLMNSLGEAVERKKFRVSVLGGRAIRLVYHYKLRR